MFHFSKKELNTKPDKPAPKKPLPKRQNMARLQHKKNNFTTTAPKSVTEKRLKHPQQTVLPPISRDPPRQTAIQQQGNMQKNKTKKEKKPKERKLKVKVKPTVERTAQTPKTVLRESSSYLTEYELEEVKKYKEVWYLGQKADKTCYSKDTESQDIQSANFGYDTKEGGYRVVIHDHVAYRFEILEKIGTGYSGQVLKCMDHKTKALVAIKILRNEYRINLLGQAEVDMLDILRNIDENNTANIVHMKEHFYFRNHLCITFELME
ncbi:hypothetical protein PAMP_019315 [Pampus punctatissimus]